jgi:hypothetical protein
MWNIRESFAVLRAFRFKFANSGKLRCIGIDAGAGASGLSMTGNGRMQSGEIDCAEGG